MRIGLDARLLAYQTAGTSTYIRGLTSGLVEEGLGSHVLLLVSRKQSEPLSWAAHLRRRVTWTPCHHRLERWAFGLEVAPLGLDVLHSPDFIPPARLGWRGARVATVHDLAFLRFPELLTDASRRYYGQIDRAVGEADRLIAVSEATRRDLIELVGCPSAKIEVVYEAADAAFRPIDRHVAMARVRASFGLEPPFVLFAGTIEPRKNLPRLFEAFAHLTSSTRHQNLTLAIAGRAGWLSRPSLEAAAHQPKRIRLLGSVGESDLAALYNAADVFVLPSLYEGFGLPLLEALACGCPVAGANVAAIPEVMGDAGVLFDPLDPPDIARAMEQILDDAPLAQDLRRRGFDRAARFSWRATAAQTYQVYLNAGGLRPLTRSAHG